MVDGRVEADEENKLRNNKHILNMQYYDAEILSLNLGEENFYFLNTFPNIPLIAPCKSAG